MTNSQLKHIAIIMDGNGRWAEERAHRRVWGHVRGSAVVSQIVEEADDLGVRALTLYAFSNENWSRPQKEVSTLFALLKKFLLKERNKILKNKIKFKVIGGLEGLPKVTIDIIKELEFISKDNTGLKLTFAFGYGGRNEILDAVNSFMENHPGKRISEEDLQSHLYNPETQDVDLLIRTGGDKRISNFLLWQSAYAELHFTKTKWPDFTREEFRHIFHTISKNERRFGTIGPCRGMQESLNLAFKNKSQFKVLENTNAF